MSAPVFEAPFPVATPAPRTSRLPAFLTNAIDRLGAARDALNLPEPGKAEDLGREVKTVHLTNYTFDGARADLSKVVSQMPAFQVTHSFAAGSQGQMGPSPGTYSFGAVYATAQALMQGNIDNEGALSGRLNYGWSAQDVTKVSTQISPSTASPSVFTLEHDRMGKDYTLSLKTFNPSLADGTGTYLGSYLQSVTSNLALGVEAVYQRPQPGFEDCTVGYMAKYHSIVPDIQGQPGKDSWIATAQLLSQGVWQATYWKKLAERVDAGVDLLVVPAVDPRQRKAIATAGVKYDFRMATFRGQVDSDGKVSALLEQRLSPAFAFLVAGEMDHKLNKSKFGVGIMVESASEEAMEAAQAAAQAPVAPPM